MSYYFWKHLRHKIVEKRKKLNCLLILSVIFKETPQMVYDVYTMLTCCIEIDILNKFILENEFYDFLIRCSPSVFLKSIVDEYQETFWCWQTYLYLSKLATFYQLCQPNWFLILLVHHMRKSLDALNNFSCKFESFNVILVSNLLSAWNMINFIRHVNCNF